MRGPRFNLAVAGALLASASHASPPASPVIHKPSAAPADAAPAQPIPAAQFDETLEIGGDAIKAKKIDTRLTVEAQVNGRGPYRFVVDSGADSSVVGLGVARELALPVGTPVVLNNMTGRNTVDRVKVDQLSFGQSSITGLEVPALNEGDLGGQGMLGIDALAEQRLLLDFDKKIIKVEDARSRAQYLPGAIVVTARRQRGQLILASVRAGGVLLDAVIDTGSEITVGNTALRDKLLGKHRTDFVSAQVTGVTGITQTIQVARIGDLQLGPIELHDVPIAFADLPPFAVFGLSDQPALLLGTDILANFRVVSLDFRARKVRFQLRRCREQDVLSSFSPVAWATDISWVGNPVACTA